jgi:molybdopterin-containing oxidoreductase family membrane subunit
MQTEKSINQTLIPVSPLAAKQNAKLWLIIFAALTVLGIICWFLQLSKGLALTNLGVLNMWGLYIVGFMLFTGVAAGCLFFAALPYLFNLNSYKPYSALATYTGAISSIVAASLFIIVDIGNPERAWLFITSGNLSSPMFWDFLMLLAYMVISVIFTRQLMLVSKGSKEEGSVKAIAVVALIAGLLVTVTSFVFCLQTARPLWNNPVQPLSFLIAALIVSSAVLMLLSLILNKSGYIRLPLNLLAKMGKAAALLLLLEGIVLISEVAIGLYPGGGEHYEAAQWLVFGPGAIGFWLEIIALAAGVILLSHKNAAYQAGLLLAGSIAAIIAVYLIKSNLLQAQLYNPLIDLAGPPLYGGVSGPYYPALIEVGVALGIVSLGCLLFMLGLHKFNLGQEK